MENKLFNNAQLKKLILPLMVEQLLAILVGLMDTLMVSSCGNDAVSGLAIVDNINVLLINIFAALATGGAVVASQYLGQNDQKNASESIKQLLYSMLIISVVICILCVIFKFQILSLLFGSVTNAVMNNAQSYFTISCLSYPFIALYNCGAAAFRAQGNSKISMYSSLVMNGVNIIGNAILIYGFNMSVAGAATSSLFARFVGMFIILRLLRNEELRIHIKHYFSYHFDRQKVIAILTIGIPTGLENGMFQAGKILVQRIVTSLETVGITAYALSNNLNSLMIIPGMAMGLAMVSVIGRCVGCQDYKQARFYTRKLLRYAYLSLTCSIALVIVLMPFIYSFYAVSPSAIEVAKRCVIIHGIGSIFVWPLSFVLPNTLRASNNARFTMSISIASMFIFRLGLSYLAVIVFHQGLEWIYVGMISDWIVRGSIFSVYYLSGKWQKVAIV